MHLMLHPYVDADTSMNVSFTNASLFRLEKFLCHE